jgi:glyoxylase-like metal-dependent hydrolase (beta-lactamase superfamily II)
MLFKLLTTSFLASLSLAETLQHYPSTLHWDVYNAAPAPVYDPPNNYTLSPTTYTLIHGDHSAVLVDAPVNIQTATDLADWIEATIPGKKLTHIYVTHGHGDHFFGIPVLQQRFPGVVAVATRRTIAHVAEQLTKEEFVDFWGAVFPNQIPAQNETIQALPLNGKFSLEGHLLQAVEVGQSDTYNTTVLHVPDLDLVVTGDAVYGECYQYLVETNTPELRAQWIAAIDKIERLNPKIVVPSHKQPSDVYGTEHFEKTRQYIRDWAKLIEVATSGEDLLRRITALYPQRVGDWILAISIEEVFPSGNDKLVKARDLFPTPPM